MFRWVFIAAALAVCWAEPHGPVVDEKAAETHPLPVSHHRDEDYRRQDYGEGLPGTGVVREIHPSGHLSEHRIMEQNKIVYDRFSPTYYQPTWILDYRYLKTGGRDYTRGEGGQILILPKGVHLAHDDHEHKQFGNFDELLEFLRLQELAEREKLRQERTRNPHHHDDHKHDYPGTTDRPLVYREEDVSLPLNNARRKGEHHRHSHSDRRREEVREDLDIDEMLRKWENNNKRIRGRDGHHGHREGRRESWDLH